MKIRSLSHIGLTVSDFKRAVRWYYEMFGFRLIDEQVLDRETVNNLYPLYKIRDAKVHLGFLRAPRGGVIEIFEFSPSKAASEVCWNMPGPTHI